MTLESTVDALISLDKEISSAELSFFKMDGYLKYYQKIGKVMFPFLSETKIEGNTVSLKISNDNEYLFEDKSILTDSFWLKYFIKTESMFSSSNSIEIEESDNDQALLTKAFVYSNTAFTNKETLTFNNLYSAKDFKSSDLIKTSSEALSFAEIKKIVPLSSTVDPIKLNFDNVQANISIGFNSSIYLDKNGIVLSDFNFTLLSLKSKNLKGLGMEINKEYVNDFILHKEGVLSNAIEIPEKAKTNIAQFKDIFKIPYIKAGDNVLIEMKEYSNINDLESSIKSHFNNNSLGLGFDKNLLVSRDDLNNVINKIVPYFSVFGN